MRGQKNKKKVVVMKGLLQISDGLLTTVILEKKDLEKRNNKIATAAIEKKNYFKK